MKKSIRRYLLTSGAVAISILSLTPMKALAKEHKTVRVGYMWGYHFQEGAAEGEAKSGFSYDWLHQIASYAGWDYEYVYGSWEECFEMLMNGEIDVMSGISYTPDREEYMNFPDLPITTETYHIFIDEEDKEAYPTLEALKGKSVGVSGDTMTADALKSWEELNNYGIEIVAYADDDERLEAYKKGETDATADLGMQVSEASGMIPVVEFGAENTYIAVSKERTDLLLELNEAVSAINTTTPGFAANLFAQYFSDTAVMASLSSEDSAWFAEHPVLQVGYLENMPPFSFASNGDAKGTFMDVLEFSMQRMGLNNRFKYHAYKTMDEMLEDLNEGKLNIAAPMYGSVWEAEEKDILQSIELSGVRMNLVSRKDTEITDKTVFAIADNIPGHDEYLDEFYPDNKRVHFATEKSALRAVRTGEADAMVMSTYLISMHLRYDNTLKVTPLGSVASLSVAFNENSQVLLSIVNRGISAYGVTNIQESLLKHADDAYKPTLRDFVMANYESVAIIASLSVILAAVLAMLEVFRRRHRREVAAKNAAEAANVAKTAFLFNMSHDIRTPMNAVLGLSSLAKGHTEEPEKVSHYLDQISVAGEQLLGIINNVLEISRIESDKVTVSNEVEDVEEIISSLTTVFSNQKKANNLHITLEQAFEHRYLYMDRTHLTEVLTNLISNSMKYTPDGGNVKISVKEFPGRDEEHALIRFVVEDDGIGMSEEYQKRLFTEFERENNSTVSGIQGTGLGLSIVKKLVDLMGGSIDVKSKKGVGTTITVEIEHRIGEKKQAPGEMAGHASTGNVAAEHASSDACGLAGKRVLLAEDIDINAMIATEILNINGLEVERAVNGQECVDKLSASAAGYYDVILMDIQMPVMDGYQATEMIRKLKDESKAQIPIIAMTANAFKEDQLKAKASGMNGHVAKPINISKLLTSLSNVLTYQQYQSGNPDLDAFRAKYEDLGMKVGYFVYRDTPEETIVYVDDTVPAIFGCEGEEAFMRYVDRSFRGMIHPEDLLTTERKIALQQRASKENIDQLDYRILRKDGEERVIRDIGYKEKNGNETLFYVCIVDITDAAGTSVNSVITGTSGSDNR